MSNRYRFPPSPTGRLHVGNVRTALYNWLLAKKAGEGGAFILRIEDTDAERSTRENEATLLRDLEWLGLDWDEGPGKEGPCGPYRQSERLEIHAEHSARLLEGGKAYYCFCSPEELQAERERALAEGRPPRYSGRCRDLDPEEVKRRLEGGEAAAVRFRVEEGPAVEWDDLVHGHLAFARDEIGDFVFVRSNGTPAYNFAVAVDDALMRIDRVLRGDDHISNTPRQILLYEALGFDLPSFGHLPMILGPDGSRLSKRHGATSVAEFRERGYLPEALINYLALLGWNPGDKREVFNPEELIEAFSLERVSRSAATFSFEKLDWLSGQHLRAAQPERLLRAALPFLQEKGFLPQEPDAATREWAAELVSMFARSAKTIAELAEESRLVFEFDPEATLADPDALAVLSEDGAKDVIEAFATGIEEVGKLDAECFSELAKAVRRQTGIKGKGLFHPLRVCATGRAAGPELNSIIPLLEAGATLPLPKPVVGVRQRVSMIAALLLGR